MATKRTIIREPGNARRDEYRKLEALGLAQEAIWEGFETLKAQGFDVGPKADAVLAERHRIKSNAPIE